MKFELNLNLNIHEIYPNQHSKSFESWTTVQTIMESMQAVETRITLQSLRTKLTLELIPQKLDQDLQSKSNSVNCLL